MLYQMSQEKQESQPKLGSLTLILKLKWAVPKVAQETLLCPDHTFMQ